MGATSRKFQTRSRVFVRANDADAIRRLARQAWVPQARAAWDHDETVTVIGNRFGVSRRAILVLARILRWPERSWNPQTSRCA
jgi:hypothetical protein